MIELYFTEPEFSDRFRSGWFNHIDRFSNFEKNMKDYLNGLSEVDIVWLDFDMETNQPYLTLQFESEEDKLLFQMVLM